MLQRGEMVPNLGGKGMLIALEFGLKVEVNKN